MAVDHAHRQELSINQATVPSWGASQALEGAARAGYGGAGLWRYRVQEEGPARLAKLAHHLGVEITTLCRGGWFLAPGRNEREARREDNHRAVDEAAEVGARVLVLVCGPPPGRDLAGARHAVADAVAELALYAGQAGVLLAVEPLHPLYCGDRSVIVTLVQALEVSVAAGSGHVGVALDSYHLWWDPELERGIAAAAGRILAVQLADWLAPPPDLLAGRGILGDGLIDLRGFCRSVRAAGYDGLFEVEIFNRNVWETDPADVLELLAARYNEHVAG